MSTATVAPTTNEGTFVRSFLLHVEIEFKDFWRSIISLAFIVLLPVMFYVGFGFAYRDQSAVVLDLGSNQITQGNYSYAGVLTFALLSVCFANVAIGLAIRRHHGLFKRFRTTPVSPLVVMGAFLANAIVTLVVVFVTLTLIGTLGLGVDLIVDRLPMLLGATAIGFLCIAPLGTALSLVPPNADSAVPIVNGIFFPLAFLSGAFFALSLGETADGILALLPGKPLMALFTGALSQSGPSWDTGAMLLLLAWGVAGTFLSLKFFKWASEKEPRGFTQRKSAKDETGE
ncbi:ABC transporter permease [Arthrobacter sp. CAN_C5]|uniref:ABC transporter permease n=1 Tax=Arthrobacter sp. CAN_C5 TaxID=2760706 RepID=UPI001AEB13FB|nr:ABC transporter permease [Arthrobacter sp. CAN_C5]MBP2217995.1 ABC-2 type transport system permease protein [Arthrobacter sp. CAN_C5]